MRVQGVLVRLGVALMLVLASLDLAGGAAMAGAATPSPQAVAGTYFLSGVACPSASSCLAVGQSAAGDDVLVPITDGVAGSAVAGSDQVTLNKIACANASSCVAVGVDDASFEGVVVPVTGGVLGAAQPVPGTGPLNGVACDPTEACVAVGSTNRQSMTPPEGVVVPISGGVAGAPEAVASTTALLGVICPSSGSCVSVGQVFEFSGHFRPPHGVVVPIEADVPQVAEPVAEASMLGGIGCSAPTTCTAVGTSTSQGTAAVPVTDGAPGRAQLTPEVSFDGGFSFLGEANAVACPSAGLCLAAGQSSVAPIVGGTPGALQEFPGLAVFGFGAPQARNDIVCPVAANCIMVGQTSGEEGAVLAFAPGSGSPAKTALSVTPSAGSFGQSVGATATVSSPAGTPAGVAFFAVDGLFSDYPQALDGSGKKVFTLNGLAPGSHTISVAYVGPRGAFSPGGTFYQPGSATSSINVGCGTTITGKQGSLNITQPATCLSGTQVGGSITVKPGASVSIESSTINGSITASGAGAFRMCASTVGGSLSITKATGYVLAGDRGPGENFDNCTANTIHGPVKLENDNSGVTAVGNSVGSITTLNDSGRGGFPFELAPRLAPNTLLASHQSTFLATRQNGAKGQTVDGIECNGQEQLAVHYHAHLAIFANGRPLAVPEGIGQVGPLVEPPSPWGPFAGNEGCYYWLHTHTQDGVIHMELPAAFTATLGDFFDLWGQPLSSSQVGPQRGSVAAFVNGTRYSGNLRNIVLGDHTLVQLDIGGTVIAPQPFEFAANTP